ncbi:MAG: RIP metalloprotease RseP [Solirubrobacteraceae bacterium]
MSWLLAFLGFALLILLHEAGHFVAAKAVGMRVERFSLFFGKPLLSFRRGETEYAIGSIPLGGYVKIAGMAPDIPGVGEKRKDPREDPDPRGYYRQPVWKRIVVIAAGPLVNVVIAFLIFWALIMINGSPVGRTSTRIGAVERGAPAAGILHAGDRLLAVDGVRAAPPVLSKRVALHACAGAQTNGCSAATPAAVTVLRDGRQRSFAIAPRFDAAAGRMRLGFAFDPEVQSLGPIGSADRSVDEIGGISKRTASVFGQIFTSSQARKQISSVVGAYEVTREQIALDVQNALYILGAISLSLALINLAPFLPLDGGHIFWALAEKLRGRAIPFAAMERAGIVGFTLIIFLFLVGLSNDIGRLTGSGFNVR